MIRFIEKIQKAQKIRHTVTEVTNLTSGKFILRLDQKNFEFEAGQYVILRVPDLKERQEYSIYSGTEDNYLDFLIREIPEGRFPNYLRNLTSGSELDVEGPKGFFIPDQRTLQGYTSVFIATGTGISPFHSYVKSYPALNYTLIHGVKYAFESCGREAFIADKLIICSSQDSTGNYMGRVTDYLKKIRG